MHRLITVMIVLSLPASASAQTVPVREAPSAQCAALLQVVPQPTNVGKLLSALEAAKLEKSEFETTDAYETRAKRVVEAIEKSLPAEHHGFVVAIGQVPHNAQAYDADKQLYMVSTQRTGLVTLEPWVSDRAARRSAVMVMNKAASRTGQLSSSYGIAFENLDVGPWPRSQAGTAYEVGLKIEPDTAKRLHDMNDLVAVLAGRLVSPFVIRSSYVGTSKSQASFDEFKAVVVELRCASLMDRRTQKILHTIQ